MEEIWVPVATAMSFKEQTMGGVSVGEVPLASPLGTLTLTQVLPLAKTLNPASFSFFRHLLQMQSHRERGSKLSQRSPARTHLNLMGFKPRKINQRRGAPGTQRLFGGGVLQPRNLLFCDYTSLYNNVQTFGPSRHSNYISHLELI